MKPIDDSSWFTGSETYREMERLMELGSTQSEEVSGDEFIAGFMRPDRKFESEASELKHLRSAQAILRDEILAAYEYMQDKGMLKAYKEWRDS